MAARPTRSLRLARSGHVLWLLRAGETAWGIDGRIQGAADLPLAPDGRSTAESEYAVLPSSGVAIVHHPGDEASAESARIAARYLRARPRAATDLAEPRLGLLEGLSSAQFAERFPTRSKQWQSDPLALAPPEGEEMRSARSRILDALARVVDRSRGAELAVVLHPVALGLVRCCLADMPVSALWEMVARRGFVERHVLPADVSSRLRAAADDETAS